jgi:hypothetical protein
MTEKTVFEIHRCDLAEADGLLHVAGEWLPENPARVQLLRVAPDGSVALMTAQEESTARPWTATFELDARAAEDRLVLWLGNGEGIRLPQPQAPDTALADAREQLAEAQRVMADLAASEQRLRQELDSLTRTDLGEKGGRLSLRRAPKVAARAYAELAEKFEVETAARAMAEDDAAALQDQVHRLEEQLAAAIVNWESEPKPAPAPAPSRPTPAQAGDLLDRVTRAKALAAEG